MQDPCPSQKVTYATLRRARRRADSLRKKGVLRINAYACQLCGEFHVGKLPRAVVAGLISRDEIVNRSVEERRALKTAKNRRGNERAKGRRLARRAGLTMAGAVDSKESAQASP